MIEIIDLPQESIYQRRKSCIVYRIIIYHPCRLLKITISHSISRRECVTDNPVIETGTRLIIVILRMIEVMIVGDGDGGIIRERDMIFVLRYRKQQIIIRTILSSKCFRHDCVQRIQNKPGTVRQPPIQSHKPLGLIFKISVTPLQHLQQQARRKKETKNEEEGKMFQDISFLLLESP